jgi:hypothetical protein
VIRASKEKGERFDTEGTEEKRRTQRQKDGFGNRFGAEATAKANSKTPA